MTIKQLFLPFFSVILFIMSSCVPTAQFKELDEKSSKCFDDRDQLISKNEKLNVENTELKANFEKNNTLVEGLVKDSIQRLEEIERLTSDYNKLNTRYNDLLDSQKELIAGNADKTKKLLSDLESTNNTLQDKEIELRKLESTLNEERRSLDDLKNELDTRNTRLAELEKVLFKKDSVVNAIKETLTKALLGFKDEGLKITQKNGKVYVSLDETLLFPSGSTEVEPKGIKALKKLGKVLQDNPDINIMIEGHTDDVAIKAGSTIKDNWDLSVLRATSIVRILLSNSKINPKRLTVAGRGEFMPLYPGKSAESRQKNRRTEIILTPKLDELFQIIDNN